MAQESEGVPRLGKRCPDQAVEAVFHVRQPTKRVESVATVQLDSPLQSN